jgi:hypothetical protein
MGHATNENPISIIPLALLAPLQYFRGERHVKPFDSEGQVFRVGSVYIRPVVTIPQS